MPSSLVLIAADITIFLLYGILMVFGSRKCCESPSLLTMTILIVDDSLDDLGTSGVGSV